MRFPLIRQGEGPAAAYERLAKDHQERQQAIAKVLDMPVDEPNPRRQGFSTAAGDSRKLRGIPVQAHGVGGTSPGSDPLQAVIEKERRGEIRWRGF